MIDAENIGDAVYQRVAKSLRADPVRYDFRYIALGMLRRRM